LFTIAVRFSDGCGRGTAFFAGVPGGALSQRRNEFDAADSGIDSILRKE
jgi:hypothetical protein